MYTSFNYRTVDELRRAVADGKRVTVYMPGGMHPPPEVTSGHGTVYLEGPHYPEPSSWFAQAELANGIIVKVK